MNEYSKYFELRNVNSDYYSGYMLPGYLKTVLPKNKQAEILDIGCGFGSFMFELRKLGYTSVKGIDVSDQAVNFALSQKLDVTNSSIKEFSSNSSSYNFIYMSHVLEHLNKDEIIETLEIIRTKLLKPGGKLCIAVPNAQSHTGAYWAYEDFTHNTLFTSGSLYYVLKAAGFNSISFLDPDGTGDSKLPFSLIKKIFLKIYKINFHFWNKVTSSSFHKLSPAIFTYELKVLAEE